MHRTLYPPNLPDGFEYHAEWITVEEEQYLLAHLESLSFADVRMHGVIAKRKVVHFGWDYRYDSWAISPTEPIPQWLLPFRLRAADVMRVSMEAIQEVLITRYEPGAGIGWHRDAPMFGPRVLGAGRKLPDAVSADSEREASDGRGGA